ncbi:hypothetical protein GGG16DRAFT_105919 [Schizophyllum commune]
MQVANKVSSTRQPPSLAPSRSRAGSMFSSLGKRRSKRRTRVPPPRKSLLAHKPSSPPPVQHHVVPLARPMGIRREHGIECRREEEEEAARKASPELEIKRATSEWQRCEQQVREIAGRKRPDRLRQQEEHRRLEQWRADQARAAEEAKSREEQRRKSLEGERKRQIEGEGGGVSSFFRNLPSHVGASSGAALVDALHLDIARYGPVFEGFGLRLAPLTSFL